MTILIVCSILPKDIKTSTAIVQRKPVFLSAKEIILILTVERLAVENGRFLKRE